MASRLKKKILPILLVAGIGFGGWVAMPRGPRFFLTAMPDKAVSGISLAKLTTRWLGPDRCLYVSGSDAILYNPTTGQVRKWVHPGAKKPWAWWHVSPDNKYVLSKTIQGRWDLHQLADGFKKLHSVKAHSFDRWSGDALYFTAHDSHQVLRYEHAATGLIQTANTKSAVTRQERHHLYEDFYAVPEPYGHPNEYDIVWDDPKKFGRNDHPGQGSLVMFDYPLALYTKSEPPKKTFLQAIWTRIVSDSTRPLPRFNIYLTNLRTKTEVKIVDFPYSRQGFFLLFFVPDHNGAYVTAGAKRYLLTIDRATIDSVR